MNCAPGGRAATSEIAIVPSSRRNHSMWVMPGVHAEDVERARARLVDRRELRPRDVARQDARPTGSTGVCMTSSGVGAYSVTEWRRCRPSRVTVSKENSRPDEELLEQHRVGWPRRHRAQVARELRLVVDAEGVARAGAGRRLDHERDSRSRGRTRAPPPALQHRRCRAHGQAVRRGARPSSAPCRGSCGAASGRIPGRSEALPRPRPAASWSGSRMPISRSTRPPRARARCTHALGQLLRVHGVRDAVEGVEPAPAGPAGTARAGPARARRGAAPPRAAGRPPARSGGSRPGRTVRRRRRVRIMGRRD